MKKKSKLEKIENKLRLSNYSDKKEMLNYIKKGVFDFNEEILCDIFIIIIDNNLIFNDAIKNAKKLYDLIVYEEENEEEINLFFKLFSNYKDKLNNKYIEEIHLLFEDKKLMAFLITKLENLEEDKINHIIEYIKTARKYYVEEIMFFSSLINVINDVKNNIDIRNIINNALENDKENAEVYSFDEEKLKKVDSLMDKLLEEEKKLSNSIESDLETLNKIEEDFKNLTLEEKFEKEINENKINKDDIIIEKLDILLNSFNLNEEVFEKREEKKEINPKINYNNELLNFTIDIILGNIKRKITSKKYEFKDEKKEKRVDSILKENIEEKLLKVNSNSFLQNLNISDDDLNFLSLLYFSLYNDTSDFFKKLIQKGVPLDKINFYFLDKENISKFGEEKYLYLILNKLNLFTFFGIHNDLDTLNKLLKLNPNYENFANTYDEVKKAIEVFKIENIADRNEIIDMIVKNYSLEHFEFLKGLYGINENLCISLDENFRKINVNIYSCLKKIKILYTPYEFSTLTNKQQETLIDFINIKEVTTVKNYKEFIKKLISVKDEELELTKTAYTIFYLDRTNLEIDDYLSLNLEEKKNFIEKCNFIYEKYSKTLKPRLKRLESKYKR